MAQLQQGLAAWRATGAEALRPYYLALLAEACGKGGQVEEGLHLLAEALAVANDTRGVPLGRRAVSAQRRATARAPAEHHGEAETCFRQALDIARQPASEVAGAAGRHELESAVAAPGQARGSLRVAGAHLRLVHRGL